MWRGEKKKENRKGEGREKKKKKKILTFLIQTSLPYCSSWAFSLVSEDPRAHDVLLLNGHGHVFPIISYCPNKTGVPAQWEAMLPEHL